MKILLADDEALARQRLRQLLDDLGNPALQVVGEAGNGREAVELAARHGADIVLLDIRMPAMDGLECARHLSLLPQPPAIIFTTAYDEYALQAFDLNAIDYLLKPIKLERLQQALKKARPPASEPLQKLSGQLHAPRQNLAVHERGKIVLLPLGDILYLRAELKYITARTPEREYLLEESLTQLEDELAPQFVRIHRNCLVNRAAITGFERHDGEEGNGWVVLLNGLDEKLPISRRQQHIVKELGK